MHIVGPWTGRVLVTTPKRRHPTYIAHRINGTWVKEGKSGQGSAWVGQLPPFSWASDKIKAAVCFRSGFKGIIPCLVRMGISKIDSSLVKWIADHLGLSNECSRQIIASKGFVSALYNAFTGACVEHAGEGDYHVPTNPAPSPTAVPTPAPAPAPGPGVAPAPGPAPAPTPNPEPATYGETAGGAANTWTNWTNAGGYQGPTIPAYATVQIACKLPGFRVADGDTWWYRIAESPWNSQYYVSADAFYNNGQTSGSLHGTPFVDANMRDC